LVAGVVVHGLLIPWIEEDGTIAGIKFRDLTWIVQHRTFVEPKELKSRRYRVVYRTDRATVYPNLDAIKPGEPVIVVEGELDALLVRQESAGLWNSVTLGSASRHPTPEVLGALRKASEVFVGLDSDDAGEGAKKDATKWPSWMGRIKPPGGKDWTEAHQKKLYIRGFLTVEFAGLSTPRISGL
jgi:DNA primase